jgi:hypothetical protein
MNYTKPEVSTLGDATTAIEAILGVRPPGPPPESAFVQTAPAYDLDE